jgi:hypothetical protein
MSLCKILSVWEYFAQRVWLLIGVESWGGLDPLQVTHTDSAQGLYFCPNPACARRVRTSYGEKCGVVGLFSP